MFISSRSSKETEEINNNKPFTTAAMKDHTYAKRPGEELEENLGEDTRGCQRGWYRSLPE